MNTVHSSIYLLVNITTDVICVAKDANNISTVLFIGFISIYH